ncbi:MAG: MBL fold metallo-hydrolase, partial [bacterium]
MIFEQVLIGGDRNFAYLAGDRPGGFCALVDPSYDPQRMADMAEKHRLRIKYIIITHNHPDHTSGIDSLAGETDAEIVSYSGRPGKKINHEDILEVGELELKIIHTPGHSPDSICILAENKLMTGDTLFVGKVGGTDFFGGNPLEEFNSLHNKLLLLPDNTEVFPGHNYGTAPMSTIGKEKETNPFL